MLTLGCRVNQSESETMGKALADYGFDVNYKLDKHLQSDLYIVNTCAVTHVAQTKSRHLVSKIRSTNKDAKIIVLGCATQNDSSQFKNKNVIKTFGTDKTMVVDYVKSMFGLPTTSVAQQQGPRTRQVFIKVQDGCDNACSYCVIQVLRGQSVSVPIEKIFGKIQEAKGNKEIVLVGINLAQWQDGDRTLVNLCWEVNRLGRPFRLSSLYIDTLTLDFIKALSNFENFVPIFHLSIQSLSTSVLNDMGRNYTAKEVITAINRIREFFPEAKISADIIVGFPTETDENFSETKENLVALNLDHLHVFPYSQRQGTVAAQLEQLAPNVIRDRAKQLERVGKS